MTDETKSRIPRTGEIVIFFPGPGDKDVKNNGADYVPAIITRIWGSNATDYVNLKVIPDGTGTLWRSSIPHGSAFEIHSSKDMKDTGDTGFYLFMDEVIEHELDDYFLKLRTQKK